MGDDESYYNPDPGVRQTRRSKTSKKLKSHQIKDLKTSLSNITFYNSITTQPNTDANYVEIGTITASDSSTLLIANYFKLPKYFNIVQGTIERVKRQAMDQLEKYMKEAEIEKVCNLKFNIIHDINRESITIHVDGTALRYRNKRYVAPPPKVKGWLW
jgi:hypothetical protein